MGEMLIEGSGVAPEYHLAPDLTKASFIKPPSFVPKRHSGLESSRLYRTGDLARYNADGTISFCGRQDTQVKIRGQRFELGEVESVLARHPGISQIAATVYQTDTGPADKHLVAILTLSSHHGHRDDATMTKPDMARIPLDMESRHQLQVIRNFAENHLATYMVPTLWLIVERLPQTASRKVDRVKLKAWLDTVDMSAARDDAAQAAPKATSSQAQNDQALTSPTTPAEVALQLAWSSVLRVQPTKIGKESSFMRLGGDSITAMQVATRCRKQVSRSPWQIYCEKPPSQSPLEKSRLLKGRSPRSPQRWMRPRSPIIAPSLPFSRSSLSIAARRPTTSSTKQLYWTLIQVSQQ